MPFRVLTKRVRIIHINRTKFLLGSNCDQKSVHDELILTEQLVTLYLYNLNVYRDPSLTLLSFALVVSVSHDFYSSKRLLSISSS